MNKILASAISYIFHPLVVTTYIFALMVYQYSELVYHINSAFYLQFVFAVFVLTFLIPGFSALILKFTGNISSLKMPNLEDRRLPFLFTFLIYAVDTFFFYRIFPSDRFFAIILGFISLNMLLVAIISLKWKISAHSSAMGGLVAFYIVVSLLQAQQFNLYIGAAIVMISGFTTSARLALNSHNLAQVVSGFLLGLFTGLSALLVLL